jgi:hypothetical protein
MDYVYPHEQTPEPVKPENPFLSVHLPLTFLSVGLALFFMGESKAVKQHTDEAKLEGSGRVWAQENLKWRKETAEKQLKDLGEAKEKMEKAVEERKALVAQSASTQAQFTSMMKELDELSRGGDKDATLIINSYGIKVNDKDAPAAAPEKKDEKAAEKKEDKPK